jgi:membrane fusion protein, multidrug efflux system
MSDRPAVDLAASDVTKPGPARSWRALRWILLVLVPLLVAAVAVGVYLKSGRFVETDNAYVKADKLPISAEVTGAVKEVLVADNQAVTAGQLLFRIDAAPYRVAVSRAEARLSQVRTDLAAMRAGYRARQAEIAVARTRLSFAQKEQQRQADLVARNFVTASRFDEARQSADLAGLQITAMEQDLARIAATLGGSADASVERHPSFRAAQAELEQAQLDLARVEVLSPVAGIASRPPKRGQYLSAGTTAMALVASGNLWVEANLTETELTHVRVGQAATIHVDTYPDRSWQGTVDSLSPATGAEFSVIPAQNATGNWVKIAQRVSVRIRLDPGEDQTQLRTGLSTSVVIDTGYRRRLLGLSW